MSVLRLAIASPLRRLFDYLPPGGMSAAAVKTLQPGLRLRVPFGSRTVTGYLVQVCQDSELADSALKHADTLLDETPLVPATLLQLCDWAARYYHHPPGEVFAAAFPASLRQGKPHRPGGSPGWQLTPRGMGLPPGALSRSPRQAEALALLQGAPAVANELFRARGISPAVLRNLADKELVQQCNVAHPPTAPTSRPGLTLNPEQAEAVAELLQAGQAFSCHLLEGVTGSGKTEVYLQLIAACLERGRQALVLIPEIGLTPQTLERFRQRFAANIVTLHSGLGEAERYRAWEAARDGSAHIVIGTRSAIFTPLHKPGLYYCRRGARWLLQATGRFSLLCPGCGGEARPAGRLPGAAGQRHALPGKPPQRGGGPLPAAPPAPARRDQLAADHQGHRCAPAGAAGGPLQPRC